MGIILLYLLILGTSLSTFLYPYIGVLAYYTLALWFPQAIWFWIFEGIRVSLYISIAVLVGFFVEVLRRKTDFSILRDKQHLYIAVLWLAILASYFFSPYGPNLSPGLTENSYYLLSLLSKFFLMYFLSVILINSPKKFHLLIIVFIITTGYYIYWGNMEYLTGNMKTFRLSGPGISSSLYKDENVFAMLFVTGLPFLYYLGKYYKNKIVKWLLWGLIPFGWHAIFLTGSRGGLVGLGVVTAFAAFREKRKSFGIIIIIALSLAYFYQGGEYLKSRSGTIIDYQGESSAEGRLEAWKAGWNMIKTHPITGVGLGNFYGVFHEYSDKAVRVAHNTVIQYAAESGILAGVAYLLLCWGVYSRYRKQIKKFKREGADPLLKNTNEAIFTSFLGFFVCSLFLNLATFEVIYYLLILSFVQGRLMVPEKIKD
jgi:putative inorganic carbon (hco3(-)) transporter